MGTRVPFLDTLNFVYVVLRHQFLPGGLGGKPLVISQAHLNDDDIK